ncbi:MAG: hypothetical protein ACKOOG_14060, partial [Actinomycetota bacterium]
MAKRIQPRTGPHRMLALAALTGALTGLAVSGFEQVAGNWLLEWTVSRATPLAVVAPVAGIVLA